MKNFKNYNYKSLLKNKIAKTGFFILFFFLILFIWKIFLYHEKRTEKSLVCEDLLDGFEDALKDVAVRNYRNDCMSAGEAIGRAHRYWQEYASFSKAGKCVIFSPDRNRDKRLFLITDAIRKSEEGVLENKPEYACQFALEAKAELGELKKSDNVLDFGAEIFALFIEIDKLEKTGNKAEVMQILPNLKYQFTLLKQYGPDEKYLCLISDMENAIGHLDKFLDGPDFQKAKSDLVILFWEMYYRY